MNDRKPLPEMSDRELADWFVVRMADWIHELHLSGVVVPVEVSFGLGAVAGAFRRLAQDSKEECAYAANARDDEERSR